MEIWTPESGATNTGSPLRGAAAGSALFTNQLVGKELPPDTKLSDFLDLTNPHTVLVLRAEEAPPRGDWLTAGPSMGVGLPGAMGTAMPPSPSLRSPSLLRGGERRKLEPYVRLKLLRKQSIVGRFLFHISP